MQLQVIAYTLRVHAPCSHVDTRAAFNSHLRPGKIKPKEIKHQR